MADRCAATPCRCCLPWQDLLFGCLGALWRRRAEAEAELLGGGHTTCLCGHAIRTLPCGHSWHERQVPRFSRCPICRGRGRGGEDEQRSWPVYSAAAAIDEQEPLVLLPPPPSRFVLGGRKDEKEKEPAAVAELCSGLIRDAGAVVVDDTTVVGYFLGCEIAGS